MEEIKDKINEIIENIDNTTILFYQQKIEEGYIQLNTALGLIAQEIICLYQYKKENNQLEIDENRLNMMLTEAMQAMENKDLILLADILQYDLKEIFQNILNTL